MVECLLVSFTLGAGAHGATEVMQSSDLRLEVTTGSTYNWRVVEVSTGTALLVQNLTQITISNTVYPVSGASSPVRTSNSLGLSLSLAGTAHTARVLFTLTQTHCLQVTLTHTAGTATCIREQFTDQQEHYYGLFEYPFAGALDNRGLDRDMIGYSTGTGTNYANARAPFYYTDRGYGIYADTNLYGHYTIAKNGLTSFSHNQPSLTYYVICGDPAQIMRTYNGLAGATYLPPDWVYSTIWWRDDHHQDLDSLPNAQQRLLEDGRRLQQLGIPAGAMWIDRPYTTGSWGWGGLDAQHDRIVFDDQGGTSGNGFPDPAGMVASLNARGMELMVWIANRHDHEMLAEALARGYVFTGWETSSQPAIDLSKPDAFAWFGQRLASLVDIGIRGYKIDRGHEGEMPNWAENYNVLLCHQMAFQSLGLTPGGPNTGFVFARNLYDRSRQYSAVWNGDTSTNWTGLQMSVKNLLRCANINFPVWGSDTGGYAGTTPTKELFARWLGFSCYSPMMEILIGPSRTIWDDYDAELIDICKTYCRTHHELMPYMRSCVSRARQTGVPVVRPLVFDFPDDPNVVNMADEYLLGDALLVAPVVQQGAASRSVYIPSTAGKWLNYNDLTTIYTSGQTVAVSASLNQVPVLLREGAILVRGDLLQANQRGSDWAGPAWPGPRLQLEAYLTAGYSFGLFDYEVGGTSPGLTPISLERSPGRIDLLFDWQAVPQPLHCRFFVDAATANAFAAHSLSIYVNGLRADGLFQATAAPAELSADIARSPADFDADYDVDVTDSDLLAACAAGPATAYALGCPFSADAQGRVPPDLDRDGDVDSTDFAVFQRSLSGPDALAPGS